MTGYYFSDEVWAEKEEDMWCILINETNITYGYDTSALPSSLNNINEGHNENRN